jgi:hypothetical protein
LSVTRKGRDAVLNSARILPRRRRWDRNENAVLLDGVPWRPAFGADAETTKNAGAPRGTPASIFFVVLTASVETRLLTYFG